MAVQMENLVLSEFQLQLTLLQLFSHFELFLRKGLLSLEMRYLVCENKAKLTASPSYLWWFWFSFIVKKASA